MTWTKLSDDYLDSDAHLTLSRSARLLALEGLVWSKHAGTDGRFLKQRLPRICDDPDPEARAAELVAVGIWSEDESGWMVIDFLVDQPSAEDVKRRTDEAAHRQERQRRHNKGDHSICDPKRCWALLGVTRDVTRESPPPVPDPSRSRSRSRPKGRDRERDEEGVDGYARPALARRLATPPPPEKEWTVTVEGDAS